jgi:protocatechuate 3,4-dioxygenase beta subunit
MSLAMGAMAFVSPLAAAEKGKRWARLQGTDAHARPDSRSVLPRAKTCRRGADLTRLNGRAGQAQGQVIYVTGRILNLRGAPCPGVNLEIWQANGAGRYTHPHDRNPAPRDPNFDGYANVLSDSEGRYRYKTIKPAHILLLPTTGARRISITTSPARSTG